MSSFTKRDHGGRLMSAIDASRAVRNPRGLSEAREQA